MEGYKLEGRGTGADAERIQLGERPTMKGRAYSRPLLSCLCGMNMVICHPKEHELTENLHCCAAKKKSNCGDGLHKAGIN